MHAGGCNVEHQETRHNIMLLETTPKLFSKVSKGGTAPQTKIECVLCFISSLLSTLSLKKCKHPETIFLGNSRKALKILVGQVVLELLIKTCKILFRVCLQAAQLSFVLLNSRGYGRLWGIVGDDKWWQTTVTPTWRRGRWLVSSTTIRVWRCSRWLASRNTARA